jgi:hypothetical protein
MSRRKKIEQGEKVEIAFTPRDRELVLRHTLAGPEVARPLTMSRRTDGRHVVRYTLDDIDDLLGFIAAEANHTKDRKLQRELRGLYDRLRAEMERYDDGGWQEAF